MLVSRHATDGRPMATDSLVMLPTLRVVSKPQAIGYQPYALTRAAPHSRGSRWRQVTALRMRFRMMDFGEGGAKLGVRWDREPHRCAGLVRIWIRGRTGQLGHPVTCAAAMECSGGP